MAGRTFADWIVILVYLTSTVVANRSLVLCREADGGTVIEIAGEHGQCLGSSACPSGDSQPEHPECRESCRDSCPCEDSSLSLDPAQVVKKDGPPVGRRAEHAETLAWSTRPDRPHTQPAARPPVERAAAVTDVTRRSLRAVVLLL